MSAPHPAARGPWGPPPLDDEEHRLEALRALELLDSPQEERFDRITRLAQRLLDVPIALVTLVDADRQFFKSCQGLTLRETPRSVSFCAHAIAHDDLFVVPDAAADPRFRANPLVQGEPYIRAYAGQPIRSPNGPRLGTLCVIDRRPRDFAPEERRALRDLAVWAELEVGAVVVSRALRDLEQLRRRYSSILQSAAEGIITVDAEGRVTLANPAAGQLSGWSSRDLSGQPLSGLLSGGGDGGAADPVTPALRRGASQRSVRGSLRRRDGGRVPVEFSIAPLFEGEGGTATGAVVIFQDICERLEIERLKDEFVSVVSHELRTPLTSIRGSLGLVAGGVLGELPAEARAMVGVATSNSERLMQLVNDILDYERLTDGRAGLLRQDVAAAELLRATVDLVSGMAREADVTIEVSDALFSLWVDPDRMVQVLGNLTGNAIKYSPPGAVVRLDASCDDEQAVFRVVDQGRGIPAERLERIFDRFEQVDASDSRAKGGTGLGLAIARSIVDAHGGRVQAESRLGSGSTFTVVVPRLAPPSSPEPGA